MRTDILAAISSIPPHFQLNKEDCRHTYFYENEEIVVTYHSNGFVQNVEFRKNGELHRPPSDGPSQTYWYVNGQKKGEKYYVDGKFHRPPSDGPARIVWHENGQKESEEYCVDGKRIDAPK